MGLYEFFASDYLQEYMMEAEDDMRKFFEENEEEPFKSKPYKENYYLRDHLQKPKISSVLADQKNRDKIVEYVGTFLDDHVKQLSTPGPIYAFTFGEKETQIFYDMFGLKPADLLTMYDEMIQETWNGQISKFFTGWVKHAPHKLMITAMLIDAIQNGYDDIIECCEYIWAFCEYAIVFRGFWSSGVKPELMEYTIEHLGAKYKIKKVKNLQELLKYDAHSSVVAMTERLRIGMDHTYTDFMYRMRNQLKNTFKNISKEYYENDKKQATMHQKDSMFDDGSIADNDGHTNNMAQIIDNTVNKFANGTLNSAYMRSCADARSVDKDTLAGYIGQIFSAKGNRIPQFVETIITIYFTKNPSITNIDGSQFLNFGLAMYRSIASSKDPLYQTLKEILNYWMNGIVDIKQYYKRDGTIIAYTRAIFDYFILMIQYYN